MRADDPLELETLIPLALEREAPGGHRRAIRRDADTTRPADLRLSIICHGHSLRRG